MTITVETRRFRRSGAVQYCVRANGGVATYGTPLVTKEAIDELLAETPDALVEYEDDGLRARIEGAEAAAAKAADRIRQSMKVLF